jgi:hypothetical protein
MGETILKDLMGAILFAVLFSGVWGGSAANAGELNYSTSACRETEVWVNEVPLPRKHQLGVTWESMSGVWLNESLDDAKRFIFDIGEVRKIGGRKYFNVEMINPLTGETIRRGVVAVKDALRASGIVTELKGTASGRKTDDNLVIFRSFKEIDRTSGRPTNRSIFVVTIRTLREKVRVCEETHHELLRPDILH